LRCLSILVLPFASHLLLQVGQHITWKTPKNRSQEYVNRIASELGSDKIHLNSKIISIQRFTESQDKVVITDSNHQSYEFDKVIFACHPNEAMDILASAITTIEKELLSEFKYNDNITYIHSDESLMPKSRSAWTSWNYLGNSEDEEDEVVSSLADLDTLNLSHKKVIMKKPVFVTYWLNKLQGLTHYRPIFVSLNPSTPPADSLIHQKMVYAHPQFSVQSVKAQKEIAERQGNLSTYYCGAWLGYGFHEDGFRSGIEIAMKISGVRPSWLNMMKPVESGRSSAVLSFIPRTALLFGLYVLLYALYLLS
jgi:predicted NAD/FAD-binding protein